MVKQSIVVACLAPFVIWALTAYGANDLSHRVDVLYSDLAARIDAVSRAVGN